MPLPQIIMPDLKEYLEKVKALHDNDLDDWKNSWKIEFLQSSIINFLFCKHRILAEVRTMPH